ncbi:MAG: SusC/RagA family TonB-linked outer membrane protein [Flavobacteriaceae bacterium]|jgi:TonB-linked SusC/RagA family outer membrane protein|nr:SusC/RagA family TonB-linked outer membrane protein [Flavobacteriaceae bacterium]
MKTKFIQILTFALIAVFQVALAQQVVTGSVTDQEGMPLPGATVVIKGTSSATTADFDGNYTIAAKNGDVLVISYVGYSAAEVTVDGATANAVLSTSNDLDEVVVTGYGTFSKEKFTGSAVTLSGEALSKKNVSNITSALLGEAVGVTVVNTSGQPGSAATVRVRGRTGSINGNSAPLYVVDGIPFNGGINAINPNDIESTTILKDAAATAIYGNRGANGVILISTKRGSAEKTRVTVDIKSGTNMDYLPRYSVIESPERFTEIAWESLRNRGQGLVDAGYSQFAPASSYATARLFSTAGFDPGYNMWNAAGTDLIDPATGKFYEGISRKYTPENWRDYAFQDSQRNEANLSISGGGKNMTYFYSVGALEDVGYSVNSNFKRFNTRLNLDFKPFDWLTWRADMSYTHTASNANGQSSDSGSVFWTTANMPRIYPLFQRDANGEKIKDVYGGYQYDYGEVYSRGFAGLTNSIADANYNGDFSHSNRIGTNQSFNATLNEDFNFESTFSFYLQEGDSTFRSDPFYGSSRGQGGYISKSTSEFRQWVIRNAIRFNKDINNGDTVIDAYVAYESESRESYGMNANKFNLVDPQGNELYNAVVNNTSTSSTSVLSREAFVGFMKVSLQDKYFLSADVRRDGTSIFAETKWGTFGSLSAAWIISNEDFFNIDTFDFLKIKTSYGVLGEALGQGGYPGYDSYSIQNVDGQPSIGFVAKGNPDLTWERGEQFNIGIEFESGIFEGSLETYVKNRNDMFFTQNFGPSIGYRSIVVNDGGIRNYGTEFDITANIIDNDDLKLSINVLGAIEKNEITQMPMDPATGKRKVIDPSGAYALAKGHSSYEYYMREWAGVNPDTGYAQWYRNFDDKNANGAYDAGERIEDLHEYQLANPNATILEDKVETYTSATKRFTDKVALPDLSGAFTINAEYKDFDLTAIFTYGIGGYAYDSAYRDFMDNGPVANMQQLHSDIEKRWQNPGDVTDVPLLNSNWQTNQASTSTRFLVEADYLNFANLQIGYSIPSDLTKKISASSARIFLTGDNLMILTKRDGFNPTYSLSGGTGRYTYEPMTTISAGLTINF